MPIDGNIDKVIVLGFYNRKNIGDDSYKDSFKILLGSKFNLEFYCMDDICEIPVDTSIVVCGGGDIINDYFMKKARHILQGFTGPVYALSVGIPYLSCTKYLNMFDHVFVRSSKDYELAAKEIGSHNVTLHCDVSILLKPLRVVVKRPSAKVIGICLAQPVFHKNPHRTSLISCIASSLKAASHGMNVQWCPINFNYNAANPAEFDGLVHKELMAHGLPVFSGSSPPSDPCQLLSYMSVFLDGCICMRYHSVMFSTLSGKPFVALYNSTKVGNLLADIQHKAYVRLQGEPCESFDQVAFKTQVKTMLDGEMSATPQPPYTLDGAILNLLVTRKPKHLLIKRQWNTIEYILNKCTADLAKYFHIPLVDCEKLLQRRGAFQMPEGCNKQLIDVARFVCYEITGSTEHASLWGLYQNMKLDTFCLKEAIGYIYNDVRQPLIAQQTESYMPTLDVSLFQRRCLIKLDTVLVNNFASYHRSGWGYTIGGMYSMDISMFDRDSDIYVDTYLDRTFHWGYDTLKSLGIIPYHTPWVGFLHHTFDTTHSLYNQVELFKNTDFIESLKTCRGLIVLSQYLAAQVEQALSELSLSHDPPQVYVLYHPTEFVSQTFSMDAFIAGQPETGIVQIGAWLRNPYSIYRLNSGGLTKMALMGKEMDLYFPPPDYRERIENLKGSIPEAAPSVKASGICRCFHSVNKFVAGAADMLNEQLDSVRVIPRISNEAYDRLLAENIVFLDLVDCSAVNTVIECIVRNTPLIVNKHPALVEVLGASYPGFYNDLEEASQICSSIGRIYEIHVYLKALDKSRYLLEHFLDEFQKIILQEPRTKTYTLTAPRTFIDRYNLRRFGNIFNKISI